MARAASTHTGIKMDNGVKTAVAVGTVTATATLDKISGKITTAALTTAVEGTYALTLTDDAIDAADLIFVSVANGTNTAGSPMVGLIEPADGEVVIEIINRHASTAFNGTLDISFIVIKA